MPPKILCNYLLTFGILLSNLQHFVSGNVNFANPEQLLEKGNMELESGNLLLAEQFFNKALS